MKRSFLVLCAVPVLSMISMTCSASEILYAGVGNQGTNVGSVLTINQSTGAGTLVGNPSSIGITGLAFDNSGNLYASTLQNRSGVFTSTLEHINPGNGALISSVNIVDSTNTALSIGDLAYQSSTNTLFGVTSLGVLYTINASTGASTLIGDTLTGRTGGLAFAPNGTLYFIGQNTAQTGNALQTLDPTTGAVLTSVAVTDFFDGLGIRPSDGVLFADAAGTSSTPNSIYTISLTGTETLLGSVGLAKVSDLAFETTPEPGTYALIGAGLFMLLAARGRKFVPTSSSN